MGAKGKNFYYDLACRYGYQEAADKIQEYFLSGDKIQAVMSVPDQLVDDVSLCGSKERIRERLTVWQNSPVTTMNLIVQDPISLWAVVEIVMEGK